MSLVGGGGPAPPQSADLTTLMVEVARNGPAFAERMDSLRKAQAELDKSTARYGTTQEIEQILARAKASQSAAQASIKVMLEDARRKAEEMLKIARDETNELSGLKDSLRADNATLRNEAARLRIELTSIRETIVAENAMAGIQAAKILDDAARIKNAAEVDGERATEAYANARGKLAEAERKLAKLNAAWRE